MLFGSLRILLAAPLLVAVQLPPLPGGRTDNTLPAPLPASSRGIPTPTPLPPDTPAPPAEVPLPTPSAPTPPPKATPKPAPTPTVPAGPGVNWAVSVLEGKVQVHVGDSVLGWADKLMLPVNGVEPIQVMVLGSQLRILCGEGGEAERCRITGAADRLTRGSDGTTLILEGKASLQCSRKGMKAEASGGKITVNLATGQIVSEVGGQATKPSTPVTHAPGY